VFAPAKKANQSLLAVVRGAWSTDYCIWVIILISFFSKLSSAQGICLRRGTLGRDLSIKADLLLRGSVKATGYFCAQYTRLLSSLFE
jgi:hypothetical protein